jgi:hypothetical protein
LFSPPVVWLHIDLSNTVGIWDDVDVNGTGTLDMDEFKSGLENLGIRLGNGVVQDSFGDLDKGGDPFRGLPSVVGRERKQNARHGSRTHGE